MAAPAPSSSCRGPGESPRRHARPALRPPLPASRASLRCLGPRTWAAPTFPRPAGSWFSWPEFQSTKGTKKGKSPRKCVITRVCEPGIRRAGAPRLWLGWGGGSCRRPLKSSSQTFRGTRRSGTSCDRVQGRRRAPHAGLAAAARGKRGSRGWVARGSPSEKFPRPGTTRLCPLRS